MKISNFVPSSDTVESLKLDIPNPFFAKSAEGGTTSPVDITGGRANAFTLFGLAGCSSETLRYTVSAGIYFVNFILPRTVLCSIALGERRGVPGQGYAG
jgi:hypothetical protein